MLLSQTALDRALSARFPPPSTGWRGPRGAGLPQSFQRRQEDGRPRPPAHPGILRLGRERTRTSASHYGEAFPNSGRFAERSVCQALGPGSWGRGGQWGARGPPWRGLGGAPLQGWPAAGIPLAAPRWSPSDSRPGFSPLRVTFRFGSTFVRVCQGSSSPEGGGALSPEPESPRPFREASYCLAGGRPLRFLQTNRHFRRVYFASCKQLGIL